MVLIALSHLVLSRTLLMSVVSHSVSHHAFCWPSTEVWHLKTSITNSIFLSTGRAVESPAPLTQSGQKANSTIPALPSWLLPLPACNRSNGNVMGKSTMSSTPHLPYHPTYTHQICHGQNMDFWKIHLKKAISWCWSQRNAPRAAYHPKLLAPLFTSWSYPQEKREISKFKACNQIFTQRSSFLSLYGPVRSGALMEGH